MAVRAIPGTDLRVSPLCLGTALFGATIDTPSSYALLDTFVERGGNFIDTARSYNDWIPGERSRSEGLIGRWLVDRKNRQRVVIATKGGHPADDGRPRLNARDLGSDIDASVSRLQVNAIDLYYLHRDDRSTPVEPIIDALNTHIRAGKVRYIACSNWKADRIYAANAYAASSSQAGFVANQPMWNAAVIDAAAVSDRTLVVMDDALRQLHVETAMACVPFSSQAGGMFSKMQSAMWSLGFRMGQSAAGYPVAPNRARFKALSAVAAARSLSMEQMVLAYLLSQPFVTVPVVGSRTVGQLRSTMTSVDVRLDAADLAAIDAAK